VKQKLNFLNSLSSFLKQHLGASGPDTADVEALKLEVTELRQKVEQLQEQNSEYKAKVGFFNCYFSCSYFVICLFGLFVFNCMDVFC